MKDIKKRPAKIFINGIHQASNGGESEKIEMYVTGEYIIKNDNFYVNYFEYDDTEEREIKTTVKITDEKLVLIRSGANQTHLIIQKDKNTQGIYGTPYGELNIGVSEPMIQHNLTENGGEVNFKYNVMMNGSFITRNDMNLKVIV